MSPQVPPPTQVLTLVLLAWVAGTAAFGTATRIGGQVQSGHFKVIWLVCTALATAAGFGYTPSFAVAALGLLTFLAVYRNLDAPAGILTTIAALAALVAGALDLPGGGPRTLAVAFASATLIGAVSNAMLLGHWHLNQPKLGTGPLRRLVHGLWAGIAIFVGAAALLIACAVGEHSGIGVVGAVTAAAFAVFMGVLTGMVTHLVRTRSIMSATGILYLEVLLALVAVFTGNLGAMALG
jgi:hypothetical protein